MAKIEASRAAAIFIFFPLISFPHENIVQFWRKNKLLAKLKKKVSSRTVFSHPAGLPETELFLWTALSNISSCKGGGVLGRQDPPSPIWGPSQFIKREKMSPTRPIIVINTYMNPLSKILYPPLSCYYALNSTCFVI